MAEHGGVVLVSVGFICWELATHLQGISIIENIPGGFFANCRENVEYGTFFMINSERVRAESFRFYSNNGDRPWLKWTKIESKICEIYMSPSFDELMTSRLFFNPTANWPPRRSLDWEIFFYTQACLPLSGITLWHASINASGYQCCYRKEPKAEGHISRALMWFLSADACLLCF